MKFKINCKLLILLEVIIHLFVLSQQEERLGNTSQCEFDIVNGYNVKRTFDDFSKMDNVWLIFFKMTLLPSTFIKDTRFDGRQFNDLTRWIWIPKKHSYLLTYPVDLDILTFRISKNFDKTISLSANASYAFNTTNLQTYSICMESLYATILKNILTGNRSDWLFCNRYFEGQSYKHVFYALTGSWLGYDFACFDSVHDTVASVTYIKKGRVNIVINIFIIVLCLYFPLLFLLLPYRYNINKDNVQTYRKGEYPNSFARLILRLHDIPKQEITEINSVEEWYEQFNIYQFKPEIHIFSFVYIVIVGMYIFENQNIKLEILDFNYLPEHFFRSWISNICVFGNLAILTALYFLSIPLYIIAMSYYSQCNSNFLSVYPWGLFQIKDVLTNAEQDEKIYFGYTKFALKFLNRMSAFFSLNLWAKSFKCTYSCTFLCCISNILVVFACFANFCLHFFFLLIPSFYFLLDYFVACPYCFVVFFVCKRFRKPKYRRLLVIFSLVIVYSVLWSYCFLFWLYVLFVIQFIFKSIIYVIFVAVPLFFNVSFTTYSFWAVILSAVIYLVKYTVSFHMNYKKLLDLLLEVKKEQQQQSEIKISVYDFDRIAEKYLPLRHQIVYFFLKITLTSLFLYVTFDSIDKRGNGEFTTSLLPMLLTVSIPALAEKLCSPSNFDKTLQINEDQIKSEFLKRLKIPAPQTPNYITGDNRNERLFILLCPVFYSVGVFIFFILNSIHKRSSPVESRQCPTEFTSCCKDLNNTPNAHGGNNTANANGVSRDEDELHSEEDEPHDQFSLTQLRPLIGENENETAL